MCPMKSAPLCLSVCGNICKVVKCHLEILISYYRNKYCDVLMSKVRFGAWVQIQFRTRNISRHAGISVRCRNE